MCDHDASAHSGHAFLFVNVPQSPISEEDYVCLQAKRHMYHSVISKAEVIVQSLRTPTADTFGFIFQINSSARACPDLALLISWTLLPASSKPLHCIKKGVRKWLTIQNRTRKPITRKLLEML